MLNKKTVFEEISKQLFESFQEHSTIPPITKKYPELNLDDAYQIQLLGVELAKNYGHKVVGKKIGLTSKAMQEMFNINVPDYGHLYDCMVWSEEEPISLSKLHAPKIETEIAFILGEDLMGPGITLTDVICATAGIIPCFEIIDSRIKNWEITIVDSVADNASAAGITLGSKLIPISECDLKHIGLVVEQNGIIQDTAAGAAVMGHPALSVAWLANKVGEYGIPLKKGEIILSGSFTKAIPAKPGDVFLATFDGIGSVKARFVK